MADKVSPYYLKAIKATALMLVWVNPNPKPSRRKFRAQLRLVPSGGQRLVSAPRERIA